MTWRQSVLRAVYPVIMLKGKFFASEKDSKENKQNIQPQVSFYSLHAITNSGDSLSFEVFRGKKVLLVNTASDCGYTAQYDELEKLHQRYKDKLVILAFPANDFKEQEKEDDNSIAQFCKINYGVTFSLMKKTKVIKGDGQHEVFHWLSDATRNGWCTQAPLWNFSKYLVNEQGVLTRFYSQNISPLDQRVISAIE